MPIQILPQMTDFLSAQEESLKSLDQDEISIRVKRDRLVTELKQSEAALLKVTAKRAKIEVVVSTLKTSIGQLNSLELDESQDINDVPLCPDSPPFIQMTDPTSIGLLSESEGGEWDDDEEDEEELPPLIPPTPVPTARDIQVTALLYKHAPPKIFKCMYPKCKGQAKPINSFNSNAANGRLCSLNHRMCHRCYVNLRIADENHLIDCSDCRHHQKTKLSSNADQSDIKNRPASKFAQLIAKYGREFTDYVSTNYPPKLNRTMEENETRIMNKSDVTAKFIL
jgi:hypothetical protein